MGVLTGKTGGARGGHMLRSGIRAAICGALLFIWTGAGAADETSELRFRGQPSSTTHAAQAVPLWCEVGEAEWGDPVVLASVTQPSVELSVVGSPYTTQAPVRAAQSVTIAPAPALPDSPAGVAPPAALQALFQEQPPAGQANGQAGRTPGGEEQKIGPAPEDTRTVFLREVSVTLQQGQGQFDWGLDYRWFENDFPVLTPDGFLVKERVRDRQLTIPFAARYGLTNRLQAFLNLPVGWGSFERSNPFHESHDDVFGLADLSAGLNYVLCKGHGVRPDVIGTFGFSAPTGDDPFRPRADVAFLGEGFWSLQANLLCVQMFDPIVLFYGVGYRHWFEHAYLGGVFAPGEEVNYNLGVGFAVNDRVTLSTAFIGRYISETRFDGECLPGTTAEPLSVRLAVTIINAKCRIIEPFVRFGLTPDAENAHLGVTITRYF